MQLVVKMRIAEQVANTLQRRNIYKELSQNYHYLAKWSLKLQKLAFTSCHGCCAHVTLPLMMRQSYYGIPSVPSLSPGVHVLRIFQM